MTARKDMLAAGRGIAIRALTLMLLLAVAVIGSGTSAEAAKKKKRSKRPAAPKFDPADYLAIQKVADLYGLNRSVSHGDGFRLAGPSGIIEGSPGSGMLRVNGTLLNLTRPVAANDGQIYISKTDAAHVINPLLRPLAVKGPRRVHTVVVDAGHGGHDTGARGKYGREKDFTLDTAKRLEKHLRSSGCKVIMTRTSDVFVPLPTRAEIAARQRDAIFVSIHYNKGRPTAGGVETFALTPPGVPPYNTSRASDSPNPGNKTDGANLLLAAKIHRRIASSVSGTDRGVKFERFHVLRNNSVPAVLVEGGFLSHPKEGKIIADSRYRETIARSIAQGIIDYRHTIAHGGQLQLAFNEKRRSLFSGLFSRSKPDGETN